MKDSNKHHHSSQHPSQKSKKKLIFDQILLGLFILSNVGLSVLALYYFQSLNESSQQTIISRGIASVSDTTQELKKLVRSSQSWDSYEKARMEKVEFYLRSHERPSDESAVYFFPEVLPDYSFENHFAQEELRPSIEALKSACKTKSKTDQLKAFQKLKSRVENYEVGTSSLPADLSQEAKLFIELHEKLAQIQDR